ncbi:MAG: DNA mismatch repair endonuclease MutL [Prevotellaceae bacterium]|jgi:DNA mismatch repair protein MutL|nr:DNA mismatch repair endonuclease MutL [Prevotellaceae bacterium]
MDIIHLLPDSIANQIAAGEVIQRPASVVKELMENSIDAGADRVTVVVKNAGRTFIKVVDTGKGMSQTDARMAFERHATSKIQNTDDLFRLRTMGFRGEALASIAAVASVELRTRQKGSDFGTFIEIAASKILKQEMDSCAEGTFFLVKNLFFNVPARRKFLKTEETELRHIITEFQRVALANPNIALELFSGDDMIYELSATNHKQRIAAVFGKKIRNFSQNLLNIEVKTSIVNIFGFVGKPQASAKNTQQFFFVNGRFMRHPYFHRAVMNAYENMLQPDTSPYYFIYFEVNPENIDVNIHPTKTEIKFEDEREIWSILMTAVKESLGKFNIIPSIDFNTEGQIDIPVLGKNRNFEMPKPVFNPNYNPFANHSPRNSYSKSFENWEKLYEKNEPQYIDIKPINSNQPLISENENFTDFFRFREKYLITSVKSGLMIIDRQRAEERIVYEKILLQMEQQQSAMQKVLFPENLQLSTDENLLFKEILPDILAIGFEFETEGENSYLVTGIPSLLTETPDIIELLQNILASVGENGIQKEIYEKIAAQVAKNYAKFSQSAHNQAETESFINKLFQCQNPNFSTDGKKIMAIIADSEIFEKFN